MNVNSTTTGAAGSSRWVHGLALLAMVWGSSALAQVVAVPAAHLNHAEGSIAWSPQGDTEWHDVQPLRVLKRGDRLWTDRGSRAEIQAGGHAVRLDGETQLVLENASDNATQISLTQGSIAITVTRVNPGDSVEIGTPNLAFRARQAGDYRIDVDTKAGTTRVVVLSGAGVAYGEKGEASELHSGQRATFRERDLVRMPQGAFAANDDFDRWAGARRRGEPTVSMPNVAQATAATPPLNALVNKGRDIVIKGPASSLPGSKFAAAATGAPAAPTAPAAPQASVNPPPRTQAPAMVPPVLPPAPAVAKAQPIPNVSITPPAAAPAAAAPATPAAQAVASPPLRIKAPAAVPPPQAVAKAQSIPNVSTTPGTPAATPLRVNAPMTASPTPAQAQQAQANAAARVQALAQAAAAARRAEQDRQAAAKRADDERQAMAASKRTEERRRTAVAARRAEEERRQQLARKSEEDRRQQVARRADETRRAAQVQHEQEQKRVAAKKAEDKRLAAAEAQKLAEARQRHLARLQEQAGREERFSREALARREQQAKQRTEDDRRAEQARREEADRQLQLADQLRRDQDRRDQEVWVRQQQAPLQPQRPTPMGVPFRRVS